MTTSYDRTARLWDAQGNFITALEGNLGAVNSANFSPNDSRFLTTSADHTPWLWDAEGNFLTTLKGPTGSVLVGRIQPGWHTHYDSQCGRNCKIVGGVWNDVDVMLKEALLRVRRSLTEAECQQYLHSGNVSRKLVT